jgi:DNA/RNA endonuclease G (NUC1)
MKLTQKLLVLFFLFCANSAFSQFVKKDTLIKNHIYESMFSYTYGQPRYVKYKLYKGGGDCNRTKEHLHFRLDSSAEADGFPNISVGPKDYAQSGYDEGHMANAEDFAYDCKKEELTFRFYNCIPQTPKLNRGIWKANETTIRRWSQTDSLIIICGGIFNSKCKKINSNLVIPNQCYKVVVSLTTHKVLQSVIFDNNDSPKENQVKLINIEAQVHFFFQKVLGFSITE